MRKWVIVGATMTFIGLVMSLGEGGITSYAIFNGINENIGVWGFLLILFGLLVMIFTSKRKSLESLVVYVDNSRGRTGEDALAMIDPSLHLSKSGIVYLSEFKREIGELKKEPDGDQLVQIIRDEYEPRLLEIVQNESDRGEIALEFLKALGYKEDKDNNECSLSPEEKRIIRVAFKSFDGTIKSSQMKVLEDYGLSYQNPGRGRHGKLVSSYTGRKHAIAGSPSDWRAGRNYATELIQFIEEDKKARRSNQ